MQLQLLKQYSVGETKPHGMYFLFENVNIDLPKCFIETPPFNLRFYNLWKIWMKVRRTIIIIII